MIKTVCDICGKEKETPNVYTDTIENMNFCISSNGRIWDICDECRVKLNKWMTLRRDAQAEREETE